MRVFIWLPLALVQPILPGCLAQAETLLSVPQENAGDTPLRQFEQALGSLAQEQRALWSRVHDQSLGSFPAKERAKLQQLLQEIETASEIFARGGLGLSVDDPDDAAEDWRSGINLYMEIATSLLALNAYAGDQAVSSLADISQPATLSLRLRDFIKVFPELRWVPNSFEVERLLAKPGEEARVVLRPARLRILGYLIKLRAQSPNESVYLATAKCLLGLAHLVNWSEVEALQNPRIRTTDPGGKLTGELSSNPLCEEIPLSELMALNHWSSSELATEVALRRMLGETLFSPTEFMDERLRSSLFETAVRWPGLAQAQIPLRDVLPILLVDDEVFNFWELVSSQNQDASSTSLLNIRQGLIDSAQRYLRRVQPGGDLRFHNMLEDSGLGDLLVAGFQEEADAKGRHLLLAPENWSQKWAWVESVTFSEFLGAELTNWPLLLLQQDAEMGQEVVTEILKRAKLRQLLGVFELLVTYLDLRGSQPSAAEDLRADFKQMREILLPRLRRYLSGDEVRANISRFAQSWSWQGRFVKLKRMAREETKTNFLKDAALVSKKIVSFVDLRQMQKWPYQGQVLDAALAPQLAKMSERTLKYKSWIQEASGFAEQVRRYQEVGSFIRQQSARWGQFALEPCDASAVSRWFGVNENETPLALREKEELARRNEDYCQWQKLGRWYGYNMLAAAPNGVVDLIPGLSQDLVNEELTDFQRRYGDLLKIVELARYPVLATRAPQLTALAILLGQNVDKTSAGPSLYDVLGSESPRDSSNTASQSQVLYKLRAIDTATAVTAENIHTELLRIGRAANSQDLAPYIRENRVVNVLLGEEEFASSIEGLQFDRALHRQQEDFSRLATTPAMLQYHQDQQRQMRIRENLSADLTDSYFASAQAGIWPILGFWLAQKVLPPGIGAFLKSFALSTRGAVNSYWIFLTGAFAIDGAQMLGLRAPRIRAEQAELTRMSQTQASGQHTPILDCYTYYQLMQYEEAYLEQTLTRGWWSLGAAAFPFVGFWPVAKLYNGKLRPWRLARDEEKLRQALQQANGATISTENAKLVRFQATWHAHQQKHWLRQLRLFTHEFKALGISQPTWHPLTLERAYRGMQIVGRGEERLRAENAYRHLLEFMAREIWIYRDYPAMRELLARAMFGEKAKVELLDEVLIQFGELMERTAKLGL